MSNPAVHTLATTEIKGQYIRIEDNIGECIHVHIGGFTCYCSIQEFETMVDSLLFAAKEMFAMRGLDFSVIDVSSFDWYWLTRYKEIVSIGYTKKALSQLYSYTFKDIGASYLGQQVPIKETRNYKALIGDTEELDKYNEKNLFGQTKGSRLNGILDVIRTKGYPYDNKYIITNQFGVIYDGAHRAACLAFTMDINTEIPVIEIAFSTDMPIDKTNQQEVLDWKKRKKQVRFDRIKKLVKNYLLSPHNIPSMIFSKIMNAISKRRKSENDQIVNSDSLVGLISILSNEKINYYIIHKKKYSASRELVADCSLVIKSEEYEKALLLLTKSGIRYSNNRIYQHYNLLYGISKPTFIYLSDCSVLLFDRLACKSLFMKSILPMDAYINNLAWRELTVDDKFQAMSCSESIYCISLLLDAVMEQHFFTPNDIEYLSKHKSMFCDHEFKVLLEKEFFCFTDRLCTLIVEEKYDDIYDEFLKFNSY